MKSKIAIAAATILAAQVMAQDNAAGRKEEARSCVPCHSLRLIHIQRLSRATWEKELDKMVRWGTVIKDREPLLNYLAAEYSDTKPIPPPARSSDK
jgi:mono/diheme cytochrome c family protein